MSNKLPWFPHYHDARNDGFVEAAEDRFGHFGYSAWFKVLECMHEHGRGDKLVMTKRALSKNLRSRWPQIEDFLTFARDAKKLRFKVHPKPAGSRPPVDLQLALTPTAAEERSGSSWDEVELQIKKVRKIWSKLKSKVPAKSPEDAPKDPLDRDVRDKDKKKQKAPAGKPPGAPPGPGPGKAPAPLAGFDAFWAAYPSSRKVKKRKAQAAWAKLAPSAEFVPQILAALERFKASDDWRRDGGTFIPHPTTWLNDRRWEDEPVTPGPAAPAAAPERCRRCVNPPLPGAKFCYEHAYCFVCDNTQAKHEYTAAQLVADNEGMAVCDAHAKTRN